MKRKLEICKKCTHMKREGMKARCDLYEFDFMGILNLSYCGGRFAEVRHHWGKEKMSGIADWGKRTVPDRTVHFRKECALIDEYEKPFGKVENENEFRKKSYGQLCYPWNYGCQPDYKKKFHKNLNICKTCPCFAEGTPSSSKEVAKFYNSDHPYYGDKWFFCCMKDNHCSEDRKRFEYFHIPRDCAMIAEYVMHDIYKEDEDEGHKE